MIDSHCHAWAAWPYPPPVPDPRSRGTAEQLIYEMDEVGVAQALVVCAQIERNPRNNAYVARAAARYPGRLHMAADLDSSWSAAHHAPGGAGRLRRMAARWPIKAFTHYLDRAEDGWWLLSADGQGIFAAAAELGLAASLACYPHQLPAVRALAERHPRVPILLHHLGHPTLGPGTAKEKLDQVLACAALPNIFVKLSGFAYAAERPWDYPYPAVQDIVKAEYDAFGPRRMCWGSDYPVVRAAMTYRQSLEAFRTHCDFVPKEDQEWILGGNMAGLLGG